MANDGPTRRDVIRGATAATVGVVFAPMIAFGDKGPNAPRGAKSLPRKSPESLGISPAAIVAFIDEVNAKVDGLHSMILMRRGAVAAEASWDPYTPERPHILFSLSKSFTSTAVGLAVADGKLSVRDKVVSFFPDKLPATVSENLAAMTVHDLLTMNTGHAKEASLNPGVPDWVKAFLAAPVDHKPGSHFMYNTPSTHMLSAIVQKVVGQDILSYLTPRIFEPLGIEGAVWDRSPSGVVIGGYGLSVKIEDIAKFGQLYLQKGKWEGKQLLPASWIAEATKKQVSNGDPTEAHDWCQGYGYQFWRCRHDHYRGDGAFGQYCIVMDDLDAVLAITSGVPDMGAVMNAAWTHLLPGMAASAPTSGGDKLKKTLDGVQVPAPAGKATSPQAASVSGKEWRIEENPDGIKSLRLTFDGDRCTVETTDAKGKRKVDIGTTKWIEGSVPEGIGTRAVAGRGAWSSEDRFDVKLCYVDGPFSWHESYVFDGDKLTVEKRGMNVSFGPVERPALKGTRA